MVISGINGIRGDLFYCLVLTSRSAPDGRMSRINRIRSTYVPLETLWREYRARLAKPLTRHRRSSSKTRSWLFCALITSLPPRVSHFQNVFFWKTVSVVRKPELSSYLKPLPLRQMLAVDNVFSNTRSTTKHFLCFFLPSETLNLENKVCDKLKIYFQTPRGLVWSHTNVCGE